MDEVLRERLGTWVQLLQQYQFSLYRAGIDFMRYSSSDIHSTMWMLDESCIRISTRALVYAGQTQQRIAALSWSSFTSWTYRSSLFLGSCAIPRRVGRLRWSSAQLLSHPGWLSAFGKANHHPKKSQILETILLLLLIKQDDPISVAKNCIAVKNNLRLEIAL